MLAVRLLGKVTLTSVGWFGLSYVLQAAKNQAALAAAKARFEQQQKENDEIAERNKRQRLGLPEPRPPVREVTLSVLKLVYFCLLANAINVCDGSSVVTAVASIMRRIIGGAVSL